MLARCAFVEFSFRFVARTSLHCPEIRFFVPAFRTFHFNYRICIALLFFNNRNCFLLFDFFRCLYVRFLFLFMPAADTNSFVIFYKNHPAASLTKFHFSILWLKGGLIIYILVTLLNGNCLLKRLIISARNWTHNFIQLCVLFLSKITK